MVNASKKAGLGNTLHRAHRIANQRRNPKKNNRHTTDLNPDQDNAKLNLRSVTAQTNLDEFFEEAELAGKQFVTERRNLTIIDDENEHHDLYEDKDKLSKPIFDESQIPDTLSVPRRPKWDSNTTPEQLDEMEKLSFLAWRRKLARLQENNSACMTPFEKNLEVWRQLWRVVERSDMVVQILDSRNPLLYLCEDLIKYVDEEFKGQKTSLILLNKADFLTEKQRSLWADYFKSKGIKTMFFSALIESANQHTELEDESPSSQDSESQPDDISAKVKNSLKIDDICQPSTDVNGSRLYNKFELLDTWRDMLMNVRTTEDPPINPYSDLENAIPESLAQIPKIRPLTIGLVGYPNVGKSSTINALLSAKRVAVSATPGKTKHFQTLLVDKDMILCDCPGLVFPNFVNDKSEMIVNGVLPIDQMKDYVGPVRIIVNRIPRTFFQDIYGLAFEQRADQNLIAEDLLNAFGFMRGYMTARGLPDISRAARKICKDYINGKILYCEHPPNVDRKLYHSYSKLADAMRRIEEKAKGVTKALNITERQRRLMKQAMGTAISSSEFDDQFFNKQVSSAHIKGLPGIGNMSRPIGQCLEVRGPKQEKKHKKREKLRRVYRHLDI